MRVLPATTHPSGSNIAYDKLLLCLRDFPQDAGWCSEASQADAVLFVDNDYMGPDRLLRRFLRHPLARRFAGSCYLFSNTDWPAPWVPGIFPSLTPAIHVPGRTVSSHYISTQYTGVPEEYIEETERDWLYSFTGRVVTSPVRAKLLEISGPRGVCSDIRLAAGVHTHAEDGRSRYLSMLARSHFILCPRGYGSSSIRLFEAMQAGRAPVIISDDWVPPPGPDWSAFSLRVRENQIAEIPAMLAALEPESARMGRLAREAWLAWFSDARTPATMLDYLGRIAQTHSKPINLARNALSSARVMLAPRQLRSLASYLLNPAARVP